MDKTPSPRSPQAMSPGQPHNNTPTKYQQPHTPVPQQQSQQQQHQSEPRQQQPLETRPVPNSKLKLLLVNHFMNI